jgi:Flp pilus assembly protein TadG
MLCRDRSTSADRRRGVAAVELAVVLPFLAFVFIAGVDFARVFYQHLTLTNCARNGAYYGSLDSTHAADTSGIQAAAQVDATNLSPTPSVSSQTGTDVNGNPWVQVTVTYTFQTFASYPGIGPTVPLARTVQMRVEPTTPKGG